uniref:NADH:flavin oxidoreductase/NADH oxidase N-terminal domain-containing protein n=1 Tax=Panagrolaimus sp. JU765 TaxID=591449 RepID=A0AC34Q3B0_9BILA
MVKRIVVEKLVNPQILGQELVLPTSKRVAKNRFMKSALSEQTALFTPDNPETHGLPTQTHVNMYEKWNAGGFGITVTGNVMVDQHHLEAPGNTIIQEELDNPERRKIWKQIAEIAKKHGNLIVAQIGHAGRQTSKLVNPKPFSSSTVALKTKVFNREFGDPVELTTEQVKTEVVDKFVYTAKYLFDAGFDGVQLHGAHGYLLAQFMSRTTNKRTDKYGGSARNRAQILVEIYNGIRQQVPVETGFIIGAKLNSVEFQNEGLSTDEAQEVAQTLDETGFDFLELSGGTYETLSFKHRKESTIKREAPAAQEFDLPRQILSGKVHSAAEFPFNDDLIACALACTLQMSQAGQKSLAEDPNINDGIMDLSDEETVREYLQIQNQFLLTVLEAGKEGKIKVGLVPYKIDNFTGNSSEFLAQKVSNNF